MWNVRVEMIECCWESLGSVQGYVEKPHIEKKSKNV